MFDPNKSHSDKAGKKMSFTTYFSENSIQTIWSNDVKLSPQQIITLGLWIMGHSAKHTAKMLHISPRTVEAYRVRINAKFNVNGKNDIRNLFEKHNELEKLIEVTLGFMRKLNSCP